ncbi:hypothetical protein A3C28_06105 [Candidatus Roizmanbacteria bacterium RIFCSPHIGHO2_02_FULL_39_9]|uniref:Steroid 5-alpha reductase C-terminal domain-containing protein n=2 Tax=Candidatus Roizmaniibacteriota TaxID=1752723 RepID=A0A1F7HZU4_9BACT|nr:MAG: hypothetical protein A3C28_06105 [Candidatus Roizmanbacteria bacterium RIFCSPHIGHO2_02_FULL_39_9]OGK36645.1 MAG: hypothetical protein A3F60_01050 [Candidatus Roizmanbacteria bacterium RIFCSPHIGHO2_12_FULL_39_8]
MIDFSIRTVALLLMLTSFVYWQISGRMADKEKPKLKSKTLLQRIKSFIVFLWEILIGIQLLGMSILPFPNLFFIKLVGFLSIIAAFFISISARREIGSNWTHAAEYQIKKNHELVTTGIYSYIRHPIYTGFFLMIVGAELIVGSYLFFLFFVGLIFIHLFQARKEEKILLEKFGMRYRIYMKKTKMFIPYLW